MNKYNIVMAPTYVEWFNKQTNKAQWQILCRLANITNEGHFGITNWLDKKLNIWELKWKCGRRIYYTFSQTKELLLLCGGNKNGQTKDINQAKRIAEKKRTYE